MKLPSINQRPDKPSSASSQRSAQLPPKARPSVVDNLEKNLFMKLQQYDDINKIGPSNLSESVKEVRTQQPLQESIKVNKAREPEEPKKIRFQEDPVILTKPASMIQSTKLKPILTNKPTEDIFLTKQVDPPEDVSSDEESKIRTIQERNKNRAQMRKMLVQEDEDLSEVSTLIQRTNSEMNDYYSGAANVKNTLVELSQDASKYGFGVKPELMDQLEQQFQELLQLQMEDDALDDYEMLQIKQRKTRGPQQNKTAARANSLVPSQRQSKAVIYENNPKKRKP